MPPQNIFTTAKATAALSCTLCTKTANTRPEGAAGHIALGPAEMYNLSPVHTLNCTAADD